MPVSIYSRYYNLETIDVNGRITITQRPVPQASAYPDSILHVVQGGETPDQLAALYYQRADLWWRIVDANPGTFPLEWQPGDTLVIPPIRVATRTARR